MESKRSTPPLRRCFAPQFFQPFAAPLLVLVLVLVLLLLLPRVDIFVLIKNDEAGTLGSSVM